MNNNKDEVGIDLLDLGKKLWNNRKFVIKYSIVGVFVGLVIAFSIPKEYTTSVLIATESQNTPGNGNMSALASFAGINLNAGAGDLLSPEIYPEVLSSTPFLQGLLKIHVSDINQGVDTSLYKYLKDDQRKAWWNYILEIPSLIVNSFSSKDKLNDSTQNNQYFISEEEIYVMNCLRSMYSIQTEKKTNLTILEVSSQSPKVSAFLADTIISYLQNYIIDQRTKKAKMDLSNSEVLYEQAKRNYYESQQNLALFVDANINVVSAKYKINQERLQNEATLAYSVYNQMAQQMQMNRIKVQDNTPVFTIIQPAIESPSPSKPKKKIIIIAFFFLGIISASGWILKDDIIQ